VIRIMLRTFQKLSNQDYSQNMGGLLRSIIFFIGFYLYLLLVVDLRLIYHGAGKIINFPVFFRGWPFFSEFISSPGGMVEYSAAFLSQLFYIRWAGALVATLQAWLICGCVGYFLKAVNYPRLRWLRFVPPILLLIIYTKYTFHFVTVMALLVSLLFICLYLGLIKNSPQLDRFRIVLFMVLSAILYYLAGGAYLLFALLCAIYELLVRGHWKISLLCLLSAVVIPYVVGVLVCGVSIIDAFSDLLPFSWKIHYYEASTKMIKVVYLMYLLLPLTALIVGLWRIFLKVSTKRMSAGEAKAKPTDIYYKKWKKIFAWYSRKNRLKWLVESLVLFGFAVGAVLLSYDIKIKTLFLVDYYAYNRNWPRVLHAAQRHLDSFPVIYAVNRALYHTKKLNLDMFSYPQHTHTLFLTIQGSQFAYWKKFDFDIDLGLMNIAQNDLTECLEVFGARPMILKRLAFVNMVKGDIDSARIYLNALRKTVFDAEWANKYLELLNADPNMTTDDRIQHVRSIMLKKDYAFSSFDVEGILSQLLQENRQNRMAFEYLMARYMMSRQLDKFVLNLDRLDDFGYIRIPRLYEEAILVQLYRARKPINLFGRQLTSESKQRFEFFSQTYQRYGTNRQAAVKELARDYGDSYLFYYMYDFSGMKNWPGKQ